MHKQAQQSSTGQSGLVISYFGNSVAVEAADGQVFQCHLRRNQPLPVVGDRVIWQHEQEMTGTILQIEPRRSVLSRGDNHDHQKILAANIDKMVIVMAPPPVFAVSLVDRYLAAAELLGITPILVLNKIDLLAESERQSIEHLLSCYRQVPYAVLTTSVPDRRGLDALSALLHQQVSVLVGPSGVGKSSIIAALADQSIRIGDVSPKGAGKHTTTATRYYHLPGGGGLIDSPGVRDFSLWRVSTVEVLTAFKEFTPYLQGCKFRDCRHLVEPDCKVQAAVAEGKISAERFASYQHLMKEAQEKEKKNNR